MQVINELFQEKLNNSQSIILMDFGNWLELAYHFWLESPVGGARELSKVVALES